LAVSRPRRVRAVAPGPNRPTEGQRPFGTGPQTAF
jgi:hypothetical protein